MNLLWDERAWDDYCFWQQKDKKKLKRINALLKDMKHNPMKALVSLSH